MIALAVLLLSIPPSGGVRLSEGAEMGPQPEVAVPAPSPNGGSGGLPPVIVAAGTAVLAAAGSALWRRRWEGIELSEFDAGDALSLEPPKDMIVVFVPGHGNGPEVFERLIDEMGLDHDQVHIFDYRLVTDDIDVVAGSERASLDQAVGGLNTLLAGLATHGRPIFIIGFSKGGAVAAELLADWSDGRYGPVDSVAGIALLDPPLADGVHGAIQSTGAAITAAAGSFLERAPLSEPFGGWARALGRLLDRIPDDGGYDPVTCSFAVFGCEDRREFLGWGTGIDPLVIRNPESGIANFADAPPGLRVYNAPCRAAEVDVSDGSLTTEEALSGILTGAISNIVDTPRRLAEAHRRVLSDPAVATCLVAEMHHSGSCGLEAASPAALPAVRGSLDSVLRFLRGLRGR